MKWASHGIVHQKIWSMKHFCFLDLQTEQLVILAHPVGGLWLLYHLERTLSRRKCSKEESDGLILSPRLTFVNSVKKKLLSYFQTSFVDRNSTFFPIHTSRRLSQQQIFFWEARELTHTVRYDSRERPLFHCFVLEIVSCNQAYWQGKCFGDPLGHLGPDSLMSTVHWKIRSHLKALYITFCKFKL